MADRHKGSSIDDFLQEEGMLEEFQTRAVKEVIALQMPDTKWEAKVKGLLKAELKRRGVSYNQLVEELAAIGVTETEPNIRNKLARGKFTAVFLVQCLEAICVTSLGLSAD